MRDPSRSASLSAVAGQRLEDLHHRAVVATHLSYTLSDPRQPDNPLIWVNPAFTRVTGYSSDEALGRNCRFLQGPQTDRGAVDRIRAAVAAREPLVTTLLNYRRDGTAFWNEVSLSPVLDADGALVSYVGIQSDVTARVLADEASTAALAAERRARARLTVLTEVATAMTDLDGDAALRHATRVLAGWLVPWCAVVVADSGVRVAATAGLPRSAVGRPRRVGSRIEGADPLLDVLRGIRAGVVELDCDPAAHHPDSVTRWALEQLGHPVPGRCAVMGIAGRRSVPGVLLVGLVGLVDGADGEGADDAGSDAAADGAEAEQDGELLTEVVRRIGLSLENSRLHAREHLVAETLQRSMLPETAEVQGLDIWSFYAPGLEDAQVGGDWYDVLQLDETSVGVVTGDVVGHDIEAAAAMGQLRSVVRAYAFEQQEPGEVLMRVDQLVTGMRIQRSASMVYARLTRDADDTWDLSWCRAGHLPPLLLRAGRVETLLQPGGPMVGYETGRRSTSSTTIGPGDVLVLYTDGLIERRARPLADGLRLLEEACAQLPPMDAAGVGENLLAVLGDAPEDDLAIVVVRIPAPIAGKGTAAPGLRSRRWQLAGTPATVGHARRLVAHTCRLWGVDAARQAELVVSELVGNAVLHGWGTVGLRLRDDDGVLVIEVDDANPAPPIPVTDRRDGPGGFGLHLVGRLATWGWRARPTGKTVWAALRP